MDENKETESAPDNSNEGVQSKADSTLDRMDASTEKLKEENDRREKLLNDEKEFYARKALGGIAEGGVEKIEKSESDKKKDDAKEYFKGTELETAIDNYNE